MWENWELYGYFINLAAIMEDVLKMCELGKKREFILKAIGLFLLWNIT